MKVDCRFKGAYVRKDGKQNHTVKSRKDELTRVTERPQWLDV